MDRQRYNPLRSAIRLTATIKNRSQEVSPLNWRNGRHDDLHAEALHASSFVKQHAIVAGT